VNRQLNFTNPTTDYSANLISSSDSKLNKKNNSKLKDKKGDSKDKK
jgi:hypothetical protein